MSKVLEGVVSTDPDIERVFVYRDLRLGIGKPFFSDKSGLGGSGPIRSIGIINEDGTWVYYLSDADKNLETAEAQAQRIVDKLVPLLKYRELQLLTNQSADKIHFGRMQDMVNISRSALEDARQYATSIKNTELRSKALEMVRNAGSECY